VLGTAEYSWVAGAPGTPADQQVNVSAIHLSFCRVTCDNQVL
jgi:hypothetical protein